MTYAVHVTGFYAAVIITLVILSALLYMYLQDEVWRRAHYPDNPYMRLFSYQSIVLKLTLIVLTLLMVADQATTFTETPVLIHDVQLFAMLLLSLHRLYGRTVIQLQMKKEATS